MRTLTGDSPALDQSLKALLRAHGYQDVLSHTLPLYEADRENPEAERELTADLETGDFHDYEYLVATFKSAKGERIAA